MDTTNDALDDSFLDWEVALEYTAGEGIDILGGFGTTENFENFDCTIFRIGAGISF